MIRERLIEAMAERKVSQGALAKAVGVTPAAIQQLVNGKSRRTRHLKAIAAFLEVSELWLEGLSDEMIDPWGGLMHHVRMTASGTMATMLDELTPVSRPVFLDDRVIPFDLSGDRPYMLVTEMGDDMSPTISPHDHILVRYHKPDAALDEQGKIWIVDDGRKRVLRRISELATGELQVEADNPLIPTIRVPVGTFVIIAKVIWQARVLAE